VALGIATSREAEGGAPGLAPPLKTVGGKKDSPTSARLPLGAILQIDPSAKLCLNVDSINQPHQ